MPDSGVPLRLAILMLRGGSKEGAWEPRSHPNPVLAGSMCTLNGDHSFLFIPVAQLLQSPERHQCVRALHEVVWLRSRDGNARALPWRLRIFGEEPGTSLSKFQIPFVHIHLTSNRLWPSQAPSSRSAIAGLFLVSGIKTVLLCILKLRLLYTVKCRFSVRIFTIEIFLE
ncbi:hypothetical protein GQ53DRAFT_404145 [Thozetella sp. PMI_491]|nr:hypothetical protein GQ53DRAFT_404145 [Thozetella sp. PMI_491]